MLIIDIKKPVLVSKNLIFDIKKAIFTINFTFFLANLFQALIKHLKVFFEKR